MDMRHDAAVHRCDGEVTASRSDDDRSEQPGIMVILVTL